MDILWLASAMQATPIEWIVEDAVSAVITPTVYQLLHTVCSPSGDGGGLRWDNNYALSTGERHKDSKIPRCMALHKKITGPLDPVRQDTHATMWYQTSPFSSST